MIELVLAELDKLQKTYEPSGDVRMRLHKIIFVPVIGPFLAGKSTVMAAATVLDHDFGRVRCFTTRPRREDEPEDLYDFLPHNEATLRRILREVEEKKLVQFMVHPTTQYAYGSRLTTWHRPFMVLDTLPSALEAMESFEFKAVRPVALTVEPNEWVERLHARGGDAEDQSKRLHEGASNIAWCLAHDVVWLNNFNRTPEDAARELIAIAKGASHGDTDGAAVAEELLKVIQAMI